jgi:translation initiation factor IF-1
MPGRDAIEVEGRVIEALDNGLFRVELANGHRLLGHLPGRRRELAAAIVAGDTVRMRLSHFDLSKGCIVKRKEK